MANKLDNLIPFTSDQDREEAKKNGIKGGIASGIARRKKATMLSVLEKVLDEIPLENNENGLTHRELATLGLVKGAEQGIAKNYEILQNLIERKEQNDEDSNVFIQIPAKDIAKSFPFILKEKPDPPL